MPQVYSCGGRYAHNAETERNARIFGQWINGVKVKDLALAYEITEARVRQIVDRARRNPQRYYAPELLAS